MAFNDNTLPKPAAGTDAVQTQRPITKELVLFHPFNDNSSTSSHPDTVGEHGNWFGGNNTWTNGQYGVYNEPDGGLGFWRLLSIGQPLIDGIGAEFTVLIAAYAFDTTPPALGGYFHLHDVSLTHYATMAVTTSGVLSIVTQDDASNNGTQCMIASGDYLTQNAYTVLIVRATAGTFTLTIDGVDVAETSNGGLVAPTGGKPIIDLSLNRTSPGPPGYWEGLEAAGLWNRRLEDSEVRELTQDPWYPVRPPSLPCLQAPITTTEARRVDDTSEDPSGPTLVAEAQRVQQDIIEVTWTGVSRESYNQILAAYDNGLGMVSPISVTLPDEGTARQLIFVEPMRARVTGPVEATVTARFRDVTPA